MPLVPDNPYSIISLQAAPIDLYDITTPFNLPLNPGSTNLTPVTPSPVAGLGVQNQIGYELSISLNTAASGSATPFVRATVSFYDDDSTTFPIDTMTWFLPVALNTSGNQSIINGRGPLRGRYMQVNLASMDVLSDTMVVQSVKIRGVGRAYSRDDWRCVNMNSVSFPNYTLAGSNLPALQTGTFGPITVTGPGNTNRLFPLFAGKHRLLLNVTGTSATNQSQVSLATVNIAAAQPLWFANNGGSEFLTPTANYFFSTEVNFPRDLVILSMINNGTGTLVVNGSLIAEEY